MRRFAAVSHAVAATAILALAGCGSVGVSPRATTEMSHVLAERVAMHARDRSSISMQEARDVPSLVEAAYAIDNVQGKPAEIVDIEQFNQTDASGAVGPIGATLYRPKLAKNTPVIIYFPGGTWATRRDADDDETARQLCARTGWVVVVPRPRLAPEAKFPAIHDDALAAYQWARGQMRAWGADPTRVVLAGEGPGANLALSTALLARDRNLPLPEALLLITPWAGTSTSTPSMRANGRLEPLPRSTIGWAQSLYASHHRSDPRIDLANRSDLAGMPPSIFVLAELDPLRSEAETLAGRMSQSGDRVDVRQYAGVTYDFFGLGAYVPRAAEAEEDVARALKAQFGTLTLAASRSPARR